MNLQHKVHLWKHETMTLWRTIAKYPRIIRFEKYCLITPQNTAARTEDLVKKYQGNHIYCIFRMHFKQKINSAPQLHQNIYLREGQPKKDIYKQSIGCMCFSRVWIKYNQLPTLCSDILELVGVCILNHLFLSIINEIKTLPYTIHY